MDTFNFNVSGDTEIQKMRELCERFNQFPNNDFYYDINQEPPSCIDFTIEHCDSKTPTTKLSLIEKVATPSPTIPSGKHVLDFIIKENKFVCNKPDTSRTEITGELIIEGDFDYFLQWLTGFILPGLLQPCMPAVDISDCKHFIRNSRYSTHEFIPYGASLPQIEKDIEGALLTLYNPDLASTDEFEELTVKQSQQATGNALLIYSLPDTALDYIHIKERLNYIMPQSTERLIHRILFYK